MFYLDLLFIMKMGEWDLCKWIGILDMSNDWVSIGALSCAIIGINGHFYFYNYFPPHLTYG